MSVAATLLLSADQKIRVPPGCTPAEQTRPGCHPYKSGSGTNGNTVALVTVILTPLGAFAVALVTAHAADARLDKQLGAEQRRLDAQLEAEAKRQEQRLRHDRRLHDLDGLRHLVDDVSAGMLELTDAATRARLALADKTGRLRGSDLDELSVRLNVFSEVLKRQLPLDARLLVHFAEDSELYDAFSSFRAAAWAQMQALDQDLPAEQLAARADAIDAGVHAVRFRDAAKRAVGFATPA